MSSRRLRLKPKLDRISALPDSLLSHILSFLPTKLAVTTSVLSKRWTPLWRSVLTLDIERDDFKDFPSFRHFVYSVIILRDARLPIRSFRFKCGDSNDPTDTDFDPLDVNLFVHAAVQRGLEIFDLNMYDVDFDYLQKVAPSVLSCRTLVILKLRKVTIDEIPRLVDLPLLKTFHLETIYFLSYSVDVMNLFNGCPILEDLHTEDVRLEDWDEDSNEEFKFKGFPNLVRANIDYLLKCQFAWFYNAKFMRVGVKLSLIYEDPIPTFLNLTHMELIFCSDHSWPGWVIQVLQHCPKLQSLIIVQGDEPTIELEDWKDPETVPECLSSQLRTCSLRYYTSNQCNLHFAEYVMLNSKLLCTMTIKSGYRVDEKAKHQMLKILSSYPRGSVTCKLLFDW